MVDREPEAQTVEGFSEGSGSGTVTVTLPSQSGVWLVSVVARWDANAGATGAAGLRYQIVPVVTLPALYMGANAPTVLSALVNQTATINSGSAGSITVSAGAANNQVTIAIGTVGGQGAVTYAWRYERAATLRA